jgi:predicted metal-dependent hydrolase
MNHLQKALGKKFVENKEKIRIREFELGGHTFKVKVPLSVESDAIQEALKNPDENLIQEYYEQLTKSLTDNKDKATPEDGVEFLENDVIVLGRSMREASKAKVVTEARITEMFKLLVPEEADFDMATITYKDIEELFPLPIQLKLVEEITNVISFDYGKTKGKS